MRRGAHWAPDDVARVMGSGSWDVVVVAAGSARALQLAMDVVAPGGRVLAFAGLPATAAVVPLDFNAIHYQQTTIVGAFGGTPQHFRAAVAGWAARSSPSMPS